jgi:outer membrane protein assembly factor BamB
MTRMDKLFGAALCATLSLALFGCGGGASTPAPGGSQHQPAPIPDAFDPARAEIMYGTVLRSTSGVPTGIKLNWTAQADAASYNLYRSTTTIPDSARGSAALQIGNISAASGTIFSDLDFGAGAAPQIGQSWFYRLSAVDSDGDESRLSPELKVDVTLHVANAINSAPADVPCAIGDTLTIPGKNFGIYNAATDTVTAPGVEWDSTLPGFKTVQVPLPVVTWDPAQITVTLPLGFTQGPLSVTINGQTANTPNAALNTDPYITSMTPTSANVTQTVTLQGKNFGAAQDSTHIVHFGTQDVTGAGAYTAYTDTQLTFTPPNLRLFALQPVTVSAAGRGSNTGFCNLTNAPPVLTADVDKTSGYGSLTVNFDASLSFDPEGTALTFDYDFNGDTSYDLTGAGATTAFTYGIGGYSAIVRAVDADGGKTALSPPIGITVQASLAGPWFMFGHDAAHSHRSTVTGPQASAFPRRTYQTGGAVKSSAAFALDGTIYIGTQNGGMYAYHPDGRTKWKSPVAAGGFIASPAVGPDGTVYFGDNKGDLIALNGADGLLKWKYPTGKQISSSPAIDQQGHIYFGNDVGVLTALRDDGPLTPTVLWQQTTGGGLPLVSSPALAIDGTVYAGSMDGKLYVFKADGSPKWSLDPNAPGAPSPIQSSPTVSDAGPNAGAIYVGCANGLLFKVSDNGNAGLVRWSYNLAGSVVASPAVNSAGNVVCGSDNGQLIMLRDNGGSRSFLASFPSGVGTKGPFRSSACFGSDGKIYAGNDDGSIYCVDGTSLSQIWQYDTAAAPVSSSPAIGPDGVLYIGHNTGFMGLGIANPRAPVGSVSPDVKETGLNQSITFTVSASSPDFAKLTTYDYDFGDGTVVNGSASATMNHAYNGTGLFNVAVTVHDDNGLSTQLKTSVKIWSAIPLVPGATMVKMADVNRRPGIAYVTHDGATGMNSVFFMRANDATGSSWPAPPSAAIYQSVNIDIAHQNFDLASRPGGVAIIFEETLAQPLIHYMFSPDDGVNWTINSFVPTLAVNQIDSAHLAFVNDIPAVALTEIATKTLEYNLAASPNGSNWNGAVPLPLTGLSAVACDVAEIGGRPAVAFSTSTEVRYFIASANGNNGAGLLDWPPASTLVNTLGVSLQDISLIEMKDPFTLALFPAVAVEQASTTSSIKFMTGGDADFSNPSTPLAIASGPVNTHLDLQNINNLPCAAWGEGTGGGPDKFFFNRGQSYLGAAWEGEIPLLSGALTGKWEALAQISNTEAVVFLDNAGTLYYSRNPNAAPQAYLSASTVNGTAPLTVNLDASHSTDPNGTIAKYEWDLNDGNGLFDAGPGGTTQAVTYNTPGTYFPLVQVTDNLGEVRSTQIQIVVN